MALAESQQFFFDLCAHDHVMKAFRQDKKKTLKKYFKSTADQETMAAYPIERYQVYRDHITFGILGGIADAFPIISSICTKKEWNQLLNDFYLKRLSRSPLARRVYSEFSVYLHAYKGTLLKKIPYLNELGEYENLDLQLFFAKDIDQTHQWVTAVPADPLSLIPIPNPHLEMRLYTWPVHQITKSNWAPKNHQRGQYPLILFRNTNTLQVEFLASNDLFAGLIEGMRSGKKTIKTILNSLIRQHDIKKDQRDAFIQEGFQTLAALRQKGIILGMTVKKS